MQSEFTVVYWIVILSLGFVGGPKVRQFEIREMFYYSSANLFL